MRSLVYAVVFLVVGWTQPTGAAALALMGLLVAKLFVTLWDFVEEDRTRKLPASERITHTLLTLNYGVVLALLVPVLWRWAAEPTGVGAAFHGVWSWLCVIAALGVIVWGLRDLAAAARAPHIEGADPVPLAEALTGCQSVLVTGATGLIGSRLVAALVGAGHEVTVLTRIRASAAGLPAPIRIVTRLQQVPDHARIDAIVNLAGEPLADGLWTAAKRRRILRSRLRVTREVVRLIGRLQTRPAVLVTGSAIGWYGLRGDEVLDERAGGRDCFSRDLCERWERAALPAEALGVRVVRLRIGLVLAAEGGMLSRMLTPFEFGLGGPFGAGRHWMSWIHRDDLVRLICHAIASPTLIGPVNGTAPEPARNGAFARALGRALGRPAMLPVPAAPLRLALRQFADELLLSGQRVVPAAALRDGFRFEHPDLDEALRSTVGARPVKATMKRRSRVPQTRSARLGCGRQNTAWSPRSSRASARISRA